MALVLAAWSDIDAERAQVADSIVKSLQPRRLPPLDRALVNHLAAVLNHDLAVEYAASLAVSAAAPRSEWRYLQAESAIKLGRSGETVRVLDEVGPDRGWLRGFLGYWMLLGRALHHLGKYDRELSMMTAARARFPNNRILIQNQLKALAGLGRLGAVDSTIDYALTLRQKGNWGDLQPMDQTVLELKAHGQNEAAQRLARRTLAWMHAQPPGDQKNWATSFPYFLYYAGALAEARRQLERPGLIEPDDYELPTLLAVICAEEGDRQAAEKIDRRIDRRLAGITDPLQRADRLMDRASIAASLGDGPTAVRMIRDAYRAGFEWRNVIHILPGFDHIRGYPPYEALIGPVE
jgi:tetratricopeptide (TPR) repeat protein